jgi:hypothetical protein
VVDWQPSLQGINQIDVTVTDNSGSQTVITAFYQVVAATAPSIAWLRPDPTDGNADGEADIVLRRNSPVTLAAHITPGLTPLANVEFLVDNVVVGNGTQLETQNVYEAQWTPTLAGVYALQVRATDVLGNVSTTGAVFRVGLGTPPTVGFVAADLDADGVSDVPVKLGKAATIRIQATDSDGNIAHVALRVDNGPATQATLDVFTGHYTATWTPNSLGSFRLTATATDNDGNTTTSARTFIVTLGQPPMVAIVAPDPTDANSDTVADATLAVNRAVTLAATASDPDGAIQSLIFKVNGVALPIAGYNPFLTRYERSYTPTEVGFLLVEATATDDDGAAVTVAQYYLVTNGLVPMVTIVSPDPADLDADGVADTTVRIQSPLMLGVDASDPDGTIASVEVRVNGATIGSATPWQQVGRYAISYTPTLLGVHDVLFVVTDNLGNQSFAAASYRVVAGFSPTVDIVSPPVGGTYLPGTSLPVQVQASDADGLVTNVDYYLNGVRVAQTASAPWRTNIQLPSTGVYTLEAVATDNSGNRTVSAPRIVTAGPLDNTTPRVVMSHPLPLGNGDVVNDVSVASSMYLNAQATDPDGSIVAVRFFINGQLIGESTDRFGDVYSIFYAPNAPGSYVLSAEAVDNDGITGQAIPILLDVGPLESPMPTIAVRQPFPVSPVGKPVELFVDATAGLVDINRVDLFVNGVIIGSTEDEVSPGVYRFEWVPPQVGNFAISARAIQIDPSGATWDNWALSSTVPLQVTAAAIGVPPSVVITHPLDNSAATTASQILFAAGATDTDDSVASVEFYVNNTLLATDTSYPFQTTWIPGQQGVYQLIALARDTAGNYSISQNVRVVVAPAAGQPPVAQLVLPPYVDGNGDGLADTPLLANEPTRIAVHATDPDGLITTVQFFVNSTPIGAGTKAVDPGVWDIVWQPQTTGRLVISAVVADSLNNHTNTSRSYEVIQSTRPLIALTSPSPVDGNLDGVADGELLLSRSYDLTTEVTAAPGRTIREVEYLIDGLSVGLGVETAIKGRFVHVWRPLLTGDYVVVAVARDDLGLTTATQHTFRVVAGAAPVVSFLSPAPGTSPTAGSDVLIEVAATDADGFVAGVEFFVNQSPITERDLAAPFFAFWRPGSAGTYTIEARAFDDLGNRTSAYRTIQVAPASGTVPSITLSATASGNVTPGSRVLIRANVEDDNDTQVAFFLNGNLVSIDTARPYAAIIDPEIAVGNNQYEVLAVVTDADGNSRAARNNFYISDVPVDLPQISIVSPTEGSGFTLGSRTTVRLAVSEADARDIDEVVFYANGLVIGTDKTNPYMIDWVPDRLGTIQLTAATLLNKRTYDHDFNRDTAEIPVTPVNIALPVNVTVNPAVGQLPSISLKVVPATTNVAIGARVLLYADVQDLDGQLADLSVRFYLDGVLLATATEPPFATSWVAEREGRVFLNAQVTDAAGNVVSSSYVNVDVTSRVVTLTPAVTLTVPESGQEGSVITLRSTVQGFVSGPEGVVFYVNGEPVGTAGTAPFNLDWVANLSGPTTFFATARQTLDGGSVVTTASPVYFRNLQANNPPQITGFSYTYSGQDATTKPNPLLGESLRFTVAVEDDGPIQRVELLRNGESVGTSAQTASPYEIVNLPPALGTYLYTVVVTDKAGAQTQSAAPLAVTVTRGAHPQVAVTAPLADQTFLPGSVVRLRATASDSDGVISALRFFVNGLPVGAVLTAPPFEVDFTATTPGDYLVTAEATDNSSNTSLAANRRFVVVPDNAPVFTAFGNDLPGSFARLNQPIRWTIQAADDYGVVRVQLFRNSSLVSQPSDGEVPTEVVNTPPNIGKFTYFAEALDSGGNITRSASTEIEVTRGTAPNVQITQPLGSIGGAIGTPVTIRASATAASEPAGVPAGRVVKVEFYANSQKIGEAASAPYLATFTPAAEALYIITAVATSDTGLTATSNELRITGVDGNVPELVSFTNDTVNNLTLTGVPVQFTVSATDKRGIARVELLRNSQVVATVTAQPYTLRDTLTEPGVYAFQVRVTNLDNNSVLSEAQFITVRYPDPLDQNGDFVYQVFLDLLLRAPTATEQNEYSARLESGNLSRARMIRELMGRVAFDNTSRALATGHWFLRRSWPDRATIEAAAGVASDGQFSSVIESWLPDFEPIYVAEVNADPELKPTTPITGLPTISSSSQHRDAFLRYVFKAKYGVAPTSGGSLAQLDTLRQNFTNRGNSVKMFLADVLKDYRVVLSLSGTEYSTLSLNLRFSAANPPSSQLNDRAESALLLAHLLRVLPTDDAVASLAETDLLPRIDRVLADPRYAARFTTAFPNLYHGPDGWKHSEWFGWFQASSSGWSYHPEYGWIALPTNGQSSANLWFYDAHIGWNWTADSIYPLIYNRAEARWLFRPSEFAEPFAATRRFFDLRAGQWIQR